jgi:hypothetical protein
MNPGSQGMELSCPSQLTIPMHPKALDDTHCSQCFQDAQFLPNKRRNSDTLSPKTIMSGETLDYRKHLSHLQVGQYCQVHEEDTPPNGPSPRTKGAISLGPSGNLQGGYKFMALNTRKKTT